MTDYATTNITPAAPPAPSLTGIELFTRPFMDWSPEMNTRISPETPPELGSVVPRSNVGLAFP